MNSRAVIVQFSSWSSVIAFSVDERGRLARRQQEARRGRGWPSSMDASEQLPGRVARTDATIERMRRDRAAATVDRRAGAVQGV
jgi:hypothetical protein